MVVFGTILVLAGVMAYLGGATLRAGLKMFGVGLFMVSFGWTIRKVPV